MVKASHSHIGNSVWRICLKSNDGKVFKANGQRLKHYHGEQAMKAVVYHLCG